MKTIHKPAKMSANHFSSFIPDVFMAYTPTEKPIHYIVTGFLLLLAFYTVTGHDQTLPEVNPRKALEVTHRRRVNDFIHNGKKLMIQAKATFGKNPYSILSEWGSLVVLPADYLLELRNDPRLDFMTPSNDVSFLGSAIYTANLSRTGTAISRVLIHLRRRKAIHKW